MKRSEINLHIKNAENFFDSVGCKLPLFAFYSFNDWKEILNNPVLKAKHVEILERKLGWDVIDFNKGNFCKEGLLLFTVRNGKIGAIRNYAEKQMIVKEEQVTPWHFHWKKAEDIINRGGGVLVVELFKASKEDKLKPRELWGQGYFNRKTDLFCKIDGVEKEVIPGGKVYLGPGESITLLPRIYHKFYGLKGKGNVWVGEVSSVNDDDLDNRFYNKLPRYSKIKEDVLATRVLCNEYNKLISAI